MDIVNAHDRVSPAERAAIVFAGCSVDMLVNYPLCAREARSLFFSRRRTVISTNG